MTADAFLGSQAKMSFTHMLIYTKSPLAEQTTPVALPIFDVDGSVQSVSYFGRDVDDLHLGGEITWVPPAHTARVAAYAVYLAEDALGQSRSQLGGSPVPVGTNELFLDADTEIESFTHFVVYSKSTLAEQTTPTSHEFADEISDAVDITFVDKDLDAGEIAGDLLWAPSADVSEVLSYKVYLEDIDDVDLGGQDRTLLATVTVGTNTYAVPPDTAVLGNTHLALYVLSNLAEATTPNLIRIVDSDASVSGLVFIDKDLDSGELGGLVDWTAPQDIANVLAYTMYFAQSPVGAGRSPIEEVALGADEILIPPERAILHSHIAVYTKSTLVEQTTPVGVVISDTVAVVGSITFPDYDLDLGELGGIVAWQEPNDTAQVTHYAVYYATATGGCNATADLDISNCPGADGSNATAGWRRQQFMGAVPVGTSELAIEPELATIESAHFLVYAASALSESTTPDTHLIFDTTSSVSDIAFIDKEYIYIYIYICISI